VPLWYPTLSHQTARKESLVFATGSAACTGAMAGIYRRLLERIASAPAFWSCRPDSAVRPG